MTELEAPTQGGLQIGEMPPHWHSRMLRRERVLEHNDLRQVGAPAPVGIASIVLLMWQDEGHRIVQRTCGMQGACPCKTEADSFCRSYAT